MPANEKVLGVAGEWVVKAENPGWGEIPLRKAGQALALARRVRAAVRKLLPRQALRRRKQ